MKRFVSRVIPAFAVIALLVLPTVGAAAPSSPNVPVTAPAGNEWQVVGGNLGNGRFSSLDQISTSNVKDLKGAWVTHLGSGLGDPKFSLEVSPVIQNGVMYVASGNDDVFALDARTGQLMWEYYSGLDQSVSTVCCGWDNRGVAVGGGFVYSGRLDGSFVALDQNTGQLEWQTQVGNWQDGYTITAAPLYYNGVVYTGISGGDFGVRGKLTALDAQTGQELWHFWTVPGPGDFGGDTWPSNSDAYQRGGATIWNNPAIDPDLGLIYFSTGNAGPDADGSVRPGDNLFSASMVALHLDGSYAWHFQQVHHDLWDYDAPSPVILFDMNVDGKPVKTIAEASKTGWLYLLDRTNGKPIVGMDEKAVPQEASQVTAATQPFPIGDPFVTMCAPAVQGWASGCVYDAFGKDFPKVISPGRSGGTDWAPISFSQQTGLVYVAGSNNPAAFLQPDAVFTPGKSYGFNGATSPLVGVPKNGTLTALDPKTNKVVWQTQSPYTIGSGSGTMTTAGGLLFHGEPDGNFNAYDARTGDVLWQWQTGAGADAPAVTYMLDGVQYVTIASGGVSLGLNSQRGDMIWTFTLNGKLRPFPTPKPPATVTGFAGAPTPASKVATVDFAFTPTSAQIKAGDTLIFSNTGAQPHTATSVDGGGFDTGMIQPGDAVSLTFDQPGTYTYLCTPHPWMIGQIVVTDASGKAPPTAPSDPNAVHQ
jgi:alcohol dehydrogenase (cytochrome c)